MTRKTARRKVYFPPVFTRDFRTPRKARKKAVFHAFPTAFF